MKKKYQITDAELEIMKLLWQKGPLTLNEIVKQFNQKEERNKSTIKTLLYRLMEKESVKAIPKEKKEKQYQAEISQEEYLKKENQSFLKKLYNGNVNDMLLNFVEDKQITKQEIEKLLKIIEEE